MLMQPEHCLSLALVQSTAARGDIAYEPVTSLAAMTPLLSPVPDAILMPPLADPGRCEPAEVYAHADQVEALLDICQARHIPLIWCVSDALYEEGADGTIDEAVAPRPRDETMRRLVEVGERVRRHPQHVVLRLGPLFGLVGDDAWLSGLVDALLRGETLRAPQDLVLCPTSARSVARALTGMLLQFGSGAHAWGTYHLCGTEPVSAYTFVSTVRTQLATRLEGAGANAELGELQALNQHHDTPLRRVLNCRRLLDVFGIHQKSWRLELDLMLDDWSQQHFSQDADAPRGSNEAAADA
nr:sugar nucleotide-binding protein [Salinicola sp. S1-1-2]